MATRRASWQGPAGWGPARLALVLALFTATAAAQQAAFAEPGGPDATDAPAATATAGRPAALTGPLTLAGAPPGPKLITLVTGDRVQLTDTGGGRYRYDVTPARRGGGPAPFFYTQAGSDGFFVLPGDALPAIRAGRLDRTLFDVKYLAEHGYADGRTGRLPVIVQYPAHPAHPADRTAVSVGDSAQALPASTATRTLPSIRGAAVSVDKERAASFWSAVRGTPTGPRSERTAPDAATGTLGSGLAKVWLDRRVHVDLDESVPLVGAPQAWATGQDGTGVTVAVLDTGIDDTHPDLAGKVVEARSFVPGVASARDDHGHGTHVASTVAGSGAASAGRYRGVASGASLAVGKVLNAEGEGDSSWIIAGMEWAATSGAKVVSMSLGGDPTDGTDPLSQAVDELTARTGTLFVIAATNEGPDQGTIGTPGAAGAALTVAATSKTDELAGFSSRGPRVGDSGLKPDIAAPGVNIAAARAAGTEIGPIVDERYTSLSGTSMATPHVAGAAAILAQRHTDWTAAQLKPALMSTSEDVGFTAYQVGAGRLDVARAVRQSVFSAIPNLDYGSVPDDQPPASRPLTYTNLGDQPVTLTLTPTLRRGDTPADSALTADRTDLTVPAHGTATATVTLDPGVLAQGQYSGAVVATSAAGDRLTTPVGVVREPPTVTLTVRTVGRDGRPADPSLVDIVDVSGARGRITDISTVDTGVLRARVPEGVVSVSAWLQWVGEDSHPDIAQLLDPQIDVSGETEITLDARTARPVTFEVPGGARPLNNNHEMNYQRTTADGSPYWASAGGVGANYGGTVRLWATPTRAVTAGALEFSVAVVMGRPEIEARVLRPRPVRLDAVQPANWLGPDGSWLENHYPGFVPFTGTQDLRVVDVGDGRPEEIAGRDLTGRLALMAAPTCYAPIEWMQRIRDAGAAAIAMYHGEGTGCPMPTLPEQTEVGPPPSIGIRNLALPTREALWIRDQVAREPVTVRVTGDPVTPYAYLLTPLEQGAIPPSLHYRFTREQLASIDLRLHGDPATTGWRVGHASDTRHALMYHANTLATPHIDPSLRQYVGPLSPDVVHFREVVSFDRATMRGLDRTNRTDVFDERIRREEHRQLVPATPGPHTGPDFYADTGPTFGHFQTLCIPCRQGDTLFANFLGQAAYQGVGETGFGTGGLVRDFATGFEYHLYRDGVELPRQVAPGNFTTYTLPAERGAYRFTARGQGTDATWRFTSARQAEDTKTPGSRCIGQFIGVGGGGACGPPPMVFVTYDLGADLAMDNTLAAGRRHTFTVNAYHAASTAARAPIAGLRVWASTDDGANWEPLTVRRAPGGTFEVTADLPAYERTTGSISLRSVAWDAGGNDVSLTTLKAVALRPAHHLPRAT